MKKYVTEFIGAFFLVFVTLLVSTNGTGALAPLAIGAVLAGMAYAARDSSGAHFNPAISLAVLMQSKLSRFDFPYFVVAQVFGAVIAALLAAFLLHRNGGPGPEARPHDVLPTLLAEFFGSFALAFVVRSVAANPSQEGISHYGLAMGLTFTGLSYALAGISGGAFNPALALGMAVGHLIAWNELWMYLVANLLGAAAAASILLGTKEE